MRQLIDCAVLNLNAHANWMPGVLQDTATTLSRIILHPLDWEQQAVHTEQLTNLMPDSPVHLPTTALAQQGVALRRYDVCVVPVSPATLAWSRLTLASIPRGPFTPLMGVFNKLKSAAMQDLMDLGMADFVRLPICPEEFRARLLTLAARMPKPVSLREPDPCSGLSCQPSRSQSPGMRLLAGYAGVTKILKGHQNRHESFRNAKSLVVDEFERIYITRALTKHRGNIAMAARFSNKHRRAFWALMRKHEIDASDYRPDTAQE